MKISKRLNTIASLVSEGAFVYDIGADHGLLEMLLSAKCQQILAIENKEGPFKILSEATEGLFNVSAKLGDGLSEYTSLFDTVVIAGMGAETILSILNKDKEKLDAIEEIIIDTHTKYSLVRKGLNDLGYECVKEVLLYDMDHFYIVMKFKKGDKKYTQDELDFGIKLVESPDFLAYFQNSINELDTLLAIKEISSKKREEIIEYKSRMVKFYEHEKNN